MIWAILSLFIIIFSTILAIWRYLVLSTILRQTQSPPTLFIIQNKSILTPELISQLIAELPRHTPGLSFEMLKKGQDNVLIMAIPKWLLQNHPEIKVLEIEDYLPTTVQSSLNIMCLQFLDTKYKVVSTDFLRQIFDQLSLRADETIFIQLITRPSLPGAAEFDANIRVIVSTPNAGRSAELSQLFLTQLKEKTGLIPHTKHQDSSDIMGNYRLRNFAKRESISCSLNASDVTAFLL
jgi:hypothetical protein